MAQTLAAAVLKVKDILAEAAHTVAAFTGQVIQLRTKAVEVAALEVTANQDSCLFQKLLAAAD
jgi:L-lactate permease